MAKNSIKRNPKKDFSKFVDMMNNSSRDARAYYTAYMDGFITLEEYISQLYRVEKEMIIRGE